MESFSFFARLAIPFCAAWLTLPAFRGGPVLCGLYIHPPLAACGAAAYAKIDRQTAMAAVEGAAAGASPSDPPAQTDRPEEPAGQAAPPPQPRFCTRCGQALLPSDRFCTKCGKPRSAPQAPAPQPAKPAAGKNVQRENGAATRPRGKSIGVTILASVIVTVCVLAGGFFGANYLMDKMAGLDHNPVTEDDAFGDREQDLDADNMTDKDPENESGEDSSPHESGVSADKLFSDDAAWEVAQHRILDASIYEAAADGWESHWIKLYYYGGTNEQSDTAIERTSGIALDIWLRDYITYGGANAAGWGTYGSR